jgi:co-chaperonin GroES (HSP10)
MKALGKRIIVEIQRREIASDAGIIISQKDTAAQTALIVAVGPEVDIVTVGDVIVPDWRQLQEFKWENRTLYQVSEEHVLAVIE